MTRLHELAREFGVKTTSENHFWGRQLVDGSWQPIENARPDNDIAMDLLAKLPPDISAKLRYFGGNDWTYFGHIALGDMDFVSAVTALAEKCREGK